MATKQQKPLLPPISSFATGMPLLNVDLGVQQPPSYEEYQYPPVISQQNSIPLFPKIIKGKPTTFSVLEDISILKAMRLYIGKNVSLKIPWSFWQLYRRYTGSQRSDSSLYHHWNGAMVKKYGNFIKDGKIDECIQWAESTLDLDAVSGDVEPDAKPIEPRALVHTQSQQVLPPYFNFQTMSDDTNGHSRGLTHFQSLNEADRYFQPIRK